MPRLWSGGGQAGTRSVADLRKIGALGESVGNSLLRRIVRTVLLPRPCLRGDSHVTTVPLLSLVTDDLGRPLLIAAGDLSDELILLVSGLDKDSESFSLFDVKLGCLLENGGLVRSAEGVR